MSTDWEVKFPKVTVEVVDRSRSDHLPLLLNGRVASHFIKHTLFMFELGWLSRDRFYDMVSLVWQQEARGSLPWKMAE
jgi:hypothetical protein